jgi:hypothetical protein
VQNNLVELVGDLLTLPDLVRKNTSHAVKSRPCEKTLWWQRGIVTMWPKALEKTVACSSSFQASLEQRDYRIQ